MGKDTLDPKLLTYGIRDLLSWLRPYSFRKTNPASGSIPKTVMENKGGSPYTVV